MTDPSIPLTVLEYQEWGNPNERIYFDAIRSYAPYENLDLSDTSHTIPIILVQAGLNDKRVCYWEPAKFTAKFRHLHHSQRRGLNSFGQPFQLLLKTEMAAGHFSKSGRYDLWMEDAFEYAFILDQVGATALQTAPSQTAPSQEII
jgi:oligopeptidase B